MPFRLFRRRSSQTHPQRRGRRIVVGDIHGCARTFRALVDSAVAIEPGDALYLLGDLISKGPDSRSVLAFVLELRGRGVTVELIRGNHEHDLIRFLDKSPAKLRAFLERTENTELLDQADDGQLESAWYELITGAHYYIELPDALLSHAGFDFEAAKPFKDTDSMLNTKSFTYNAEIAGGRSVIHGHVPTPLSTILQRVAEGDPVIPLDNRVVGASKSAWKISEYGNLCAYDLDERSLYVQPNIDHLDGELAAGRYYSLCAKGAPAPGLQGPSAS